MDLSSIELPTEIWKQIIQKISTPVAWIHLRATSTQMRKIIDTFFLSEISSIAVRAEATRSFTDNSTVTVVVSSDKYPNTQGEFEIRLFFARIAFRFFWKQAKRLHTLIINGSTKRTLGPYFFHMEHNPSSFAWIISGIRRTSKRFPKIIKRLDIRSYASLEPYSKANEDQKMDNMHLIINCQPHTLVFQLDWNHVQTLAGILPQCNIQRYEILFGSAPYHGDCGFLARDWQTGSLFHEITLLPIIIAKAQKVVTALTIKIADGFVGSPADSVHIYHYLGVRQRLTSKLITHALKNLPPTPHFFLDFEKQQIEEDYWGNSDTLLRGVRPPPATPFQQELKTLSFGIMTARRGPESSANPYFYVWPPYQLFEKLESIHGLVFNQNLIAGIAELLGKGDFPESPIKPHTETVPGDRICRIYCRKEKDDPSQFLIGQKFMRDWDRIKRISSPIRQLHRRSRWIRRLQTYVTLQDDIDEFTDERTITITCGKCSGTHTIQVKVPSGTEPHSLQQNG
jgi:hypothetical protein